MRGRWQGRGMPQIQLPMFPAGAVEVTGDLACRCEGEQVVYFHGQLPVFTHAKNDVASFRMFTSQLIVQGTATTGQVQRAFGVPLVSIKRATKLYRARGVAGFFAPKPRREGPTLTPGKLDEARALLAAGEPVARVGELLNVLSDTLRKAIAAGRLLGLDRLPEVKTLRAKIALLCATAGQAGQWQTRLAQEWIAAATDPVDPVAAPGLGLFYVDGHVRVYHGGLTSLPRRYVARQRLCLRGTTDYWVNGLGGEPFFVVTQPVNAGLLAALRDHVIPQLLASLPAVPASAPPSTLPAKASAPWVPRCTVVFDREGYSPEAFADYKACGVAILTYHKFPGEAWPTAEFAPATLRRHSGELVPRELAERGTRLSNGLWVREVRVVQAGDTHQTSILTTHPGLDLPVVAARMADRWTQENFLKYMRENFGLDRIIEHGTTPLPDTTLVVNPARRRLEADLRRHRADLQRSHARLGALVLPVAATPEQATAFLTQGGELRTAIATTTARLATRQAERKTTPKKVALKELPANERFAQLCPESKHFIDPKNGS